MKIAVEEFWEEVDKTSTEATSRHVDTPCWEWTGKRIGWYGYIVNRVRMKRAHRVAWELTHGPVPDGMCVLHRCDNPLCVNPEHLWSGTHGDNMRDKVAKGRCNMPTGKNHWAKRKPERVARGERHGTYTRPERVARGEDNGANTKPEKVPRGEKSGMSKLRESDVHDIRRRVKEKQTKKQIMAEYPHAPNAAYDVAAGKTWRHV